MIGSDQILNHNVTKLVEEVRILEPKSRTPNLKTQTSSPRPGTQNHTVTTRSVSMRCTLNPNPQTLNRLPLNTKTLKRKPKTGDHQGGGRGGVLARRLALVPGVDLGPQGHRRQDQGHLSHRPTQVPRPYPLSGEGVKLTTTRS